MKKLNTLNKLWTAICDLDVNTIKDVEKEIAIREKEIAELKEVLHIFEQLTFRGFKVNYRNVDAAFFYHPSTLKEFVKDKDKTTSNLGKKAILFREAVVKILERVK